MTEAFQPRVGVGVLLVVCPKKTSTGFPRHILPRYAKAFPRTVSRKRPPLFAIHDLPANLTMTARNAIRACLGRYSSQASVAGR